MYTRAGTRVPCCASGPWVWDEQELGASSVPLRSSPPAPGPAGRLLQESGESLAWGDQQAAGLKEGEAMEEGDGLRLFEGQGQAPRDGLSALDRLLWPPKPLLLHSPPQKLKKPIPDSSRVRMEENISETWLKCLLHLGLLWALALQTVFLSLAHTQPERSSEVWFTGRQRLLLWASLHAWPT